MAYKKKLYSYRPDRIIAPVQSFQTARRLRLEACDPQSLERGVRQLLSDKISGNMVGLWFLVPEHLRLGTWDLLCRWSGGVSDQFPPRLGLQLVHEASLCVTGIRQARTLSQKGFEVLNGLPFVASDQAIHDFLDQRTIADSERLQVELGLIRRARGHFRGKILAFDPHRLHSSSKRQMCRKVENGDSPPYKVSQTFFCLDADTKQPVCFTLSSAALSVSQATPPLLRLCESILNPTAKEILVLADTEHYGAELIDFFHDHGGCDILVPVPKRKTFQDWVTTLPDQAFTRHWAGYATAKVPYALTNSRTGTHFMLVQRCGERRSAYWYKMFYCSGDRDELDDLTRNFPERWHIEEFFRSYQALGWQKGRTLNLNIRYGQMTTALLAQAAIQQLKQRLAPACQSWDAEHLAKDFFRGIDGDIRVQKDTIIVTCYNAPDVELLKRHYENLPAKLTQEGLDPTIPWLFNFKLDFRFK